MIKGQAPIKVEVDGKKISYLITTEAGPRL
jgi:hypothetical protein